MLCGATGCVYMYPILINSNYIHFNIAAIHTVFDYSLTHGYLLHFQQQFYYLILGLECVKEVV